MSISDEEWSRARKAAGAPPFEPAKVIAWLEAAKDRIEKEYMERNPHPSNGSGETSCRIDDAEVALRGLFDCWGDL